MNIIEARNHPDIFGGLRGNAATWRAWDCVLKAAFALPMDRTERRLFNNLAKRNPPKAPVKELWAVCGRRAGKTSTAAEIAVWYAAFGDYRAALQPGERAVIMLLAVDRAQAGVALDYIRALLREAPGLQQLDGQPLVRKETQDSVELSNGAVIQVGTNNFRLVRGRTIVCCVFDEVSFWRDENSATPDVETYNALLPAMATIPNSLLIGISSPYRRAGLLYDKWSKHFGKADPDVLVIQAASRDLNPTIDKSVVDRALEADPSAARAEWLAEFRDDVTGFLDSTWVEAAIEPRMTQLAPRDGVGYSAFCDPAGGGKDEFTLAIGHFEDKKRVIDLVMARTGKPHPIVAEYAAILKEYWVLDVVGDRYAAGWVKDAFAEQGITYRHAKQNRSEIYLETGPLFATGLVVIPDEQKLATQLKQLERRTSRGGRDVVDHPPHGADDRANAVCGCAWVHTAMPKSVPMIWSIDDDPVPVPGIWLPVFGNGGLSD